MTRVRYLLSLVDRRDRTWGAAVLVAVVGIAFGAGMVTAAHRAQADRATACAARVHAEDARYRARGWQVVRMAMPCESERAR